MRRRRAGRRPGLLRPQRLAGGAAPGLRRLPRRHRRRQHGQGRTRLRPDRPGIHERGLRTPFSAAADRRLLELQSLRRRRGVRPRPGLPQRPGRRPARRHGCGVSRGVYGRGADVRARAGLPARRRPARPGAAIARAAERLGNRLAVRRAGEPGAGAARPGPPRLQPRLRRFRPGRRPYRLGRPAADRPGADGVLPRPAHLDAAALAPPPRNQAVADLLAPLLPPRPAPAGRVLHAALRRRSRVARGDERPRGPAAVARAGRQPAQRPHVRLLRRADGVLRRSVDAGGRGRRGPERPGPALGVAAAARREPAAACRSGPS